MCALSEDPRTSRAASGEITIKVAASRVSATLNHENHRQRLLGKWQVVNRMHVVRKHRARGLSSSAAWRASAGLFLLNMAAGIVRRRRDPLNRALGNAAGMLSELLGRREQLGGHLK